MTHNFDLVIAAAGSSERFNKDSQNKIKKECIRIEGKTVLSMSIKAFLEIDGLCSIIVTYPKDHLEEIKQALSNLTLSPNHCLHYVEGGNTRTESIKNALCFLSTISSKAELVAIHDGARPFVTEKIILSTLEMASLYGSSAPGVKITDAVKSIDSEGFVHTNLDRTNLRRLQTPQIFSKEKILRLYNNLSPSLSFADDVELFTLSGERCFITEGSESNKKITYREDINRENMRVGFGNDIHRLCENRRLMIGGVALPHSKGEEAHSDGDVLLHAIIDSILGAKALGDIGHFFPPEDMKWKDVDSKELIKIILSKIDVDIINLDAVITLEGFKLAPYILQIRESLSSLLKLDISKISVKAKTNEGLDSLGKGEAIKAEVVILING